MGRKKDRRKNKNTGTLVRRLFVFALAAFMIFQFSTVSFSGIAFADSDDKYKDFKVSNTVIGGSEDEEFDYTMDVTLHGPFEIGDVSNFVNFMQDHSKMISNEDLQAAVAAMIDIVLSSGSSSYDTLIIFTFHFSLEDGESETFSVPKRTEITVTEKGAEGYIPSAGDKTGTVGKDLVIKTAIQGDTTLAFVNKYHPEISFASLDGTWAYDGKNHEKPEYTVTCDKKEYNAAAADGKKSAAVTLDNGFVITITPDSDASVKNVADSGKKNNTFTFTVADRTGYDFTADYKNADITYGSLEITRSPLTIVTPSATKEYDGTALTATEAEVTGLVNGETATVTVTGSRTEVGSSPNTYSISWGTADPANYRIRENLGTLTVTEEEIEDPDVAPIAPYRPPVKPSDNKINPAAAAGLTALTADPSDEPEEPEEVPDEPDPDEPEDVPEDEPEDIPENEPEDIPEDDTPLAGGAWALINLLCAIGSALTSIILLITGKKDKGQLGPQTAAEGGYEETKDLSRKGLMRILSLIPGIGSVIVFFLTEDMSLPMVMTDKWTILMVILLAVTAVMAVLSRKTKKE